MPPKRKPVKDDDDSSAEVTLAKPKRGKKEQKEVVKETGVTAEPSEKPAAKAKKLSKKATKVEDVDASLETPTVTSSLSKSLSTSSVFSEGGEIERDPIPRLPAPAKESFSVISWNVNGLRALDGKGILEKLAASHRPDLLVLQETKLQESHVAGMAKKLLPDYESHWTCSIAQKGYAGSVAFVRKAGRRPIKVTFGIGKAKHDDEGRSITIEYDKFFVVALYVPNSGQKLERLEYRVKEWDVDLREYVKGLEKTKPVVITGDLNVAHLDQDIYNFSAKHIVKISGCTPQERKSFGDWLSTGYVDAFRQQHGLVKGAFSYWSMRTNGRGTNRGLRLDYFVASKAMAQAGSSPSLYDSFILETDTVGASDHCPVGLVLTF